jgi:hypothetical protein
MAMYMWRSCDVIEALVDHVDMRRPVWPFVCECCTQSMCEMRCLKLHGDDCGPIVAVRFSMVGGLSGALLCERIPWFYNHDMQRVGSIV